MAATGTPLRVTPMSRMAPVMFHMPTIARQRDGETLDGALWSAAQEWARARHCTVEDCGCEGDPLPHAHLGTHYVAESARIMAGMEVFTGLSLDLRTELARRIVYDRVDQITGRTRAGGVELEEAAVRAQRAYLQLPPLA